MLEQIIPPFLPLITHYSLKPGRWYWHVWKLDICWLLVFVDYWWKLIMHVMPFVFLFSNTIQMYINWWTNKQNVLVFPTQWNTTQQQKEILTHATVWINLKNIIIYGRSHTQKATYCTCFGSTYTKNWNNTEKANMVPTKW